MMFDDFWGNQEYAPLESTLKEVFPDRSPQELPIDHPVFHFVFPLAEKPQIPNVGRGTESQYDGITYEQWDAQTPYYKGMFDDDGRLMMIICHNTDLGDGWEDISVHGNDESKRQEALRMGTNIILYSLLR